MSERRTYKPILTGKDLLPSAKPNLNQRNQTVINIEFNNEGTDVFRKFTRAHVGDYLAVFFDGKLLTAPSINEAIPSGKAEITGFKSLQEARQIAEFLNAGALPVPLKVIAKDSVEPTLGKETVSQGCAGGYRRPGPGCPVHVGLLQTAGRYRRHRSLSVCAFPDCHIQADRGHDVACRCRGFDHIHRYGG